MKKIMSIVIIGFLLVSGAGILVQARDSIDDYGCVNNHETINSIPSSDVITVLIPIGSYVIKNTVEGQKIFIDNFGRLSKPGEPFLPSRIYSIAIPPMAKLVDIIYDVGEGIVLPGNYDIPPVPSPNIMIEKDVLSNSFKRYIKTFEENYDLIYSSNELYPANIVKFIRISNYRKYNLVDVRVTPFNYRPLSGQLVFHPEVKLQLRYCLPQKQNCIMVDNSANIEKVAKEIIFNYDQVKDWYSANNIINKGLHDFVIITLDSLESAVKPLVDWETLKGRTVKVVNISWINSNYQGYDLAEKMRNFLREKYPVEDWGIEDLLIIGHHDDIPMRQVWQVANPQQNKPETDFYYAELSKSDSESWDEDGDHKYGEDSDPIDFYAEINVGRIPWSDYEIVQHICQKSVAYEQNADPSFKNNILVLGAIVDSVTDGATFMEYCIDKTIHPWMAHWSKTRIYERSSNYPRDYVLNHNNVISVWSEGKFGFVSWHAHGSPTGSYVGNQAFISVDDCSLLNDEYPAIISAASCSNSDTDYLNIGQAMMKQGAVGFLGANKVAFYQSRWDHPNDGSDQSFKYFFTSAVTSGNHTQGQAHQYALREMYTKGLWISPFYEAFCHGSLWGNPDLGIVPISENNPPIKPITPNGPNSGKIGTEYNYSSVSTDPDVDQIYYCWSWGDKDTEWLGPFASGEECSALHIWDGQGTYTIKVKARDIHGGDSDWSDPLVVTITKNRVINTPFLQFLEQYPLLYQLLLRFLRL